MITSEICQGDSSYNYVLILFKDMDEQIDHTNWIKTQASKYSILFCITIIVIVCVYTISISQIRRKISVNERSLHLGKHSSEQLCFSPGNGAFLRDRLRQPVIDKYDNNSAYVDASDALKQPSISKNYTSLTDFIVQLREVLLSRRLQPGSLSISTIFHRPPFKDIVKPACDGLWMEFGV